MSVQIHIQERNSASMFQAPEIEEGTALSASQQVTEEGTALSASQQATEEGTALSASQQATEASQQATEERTALSTCQQATEDAIVNEKYSRDVPLPNLVKGVGTQRHYHKRNAATASLRVSIMDPSSRRQPVEETDVQVKAKEMGLNLHEKMLLVNSPTRFEDTSYVTCDDLKEAHTIVQQAIHKCPRASGPVLLAHHQDVHSSITWIKEHSEEQNRNEGRLKPLNGIEDGTNKLNEAFTNLALAVVRLENPSTVLFKAVMKVMASPKYPLVGKESKYNISYPTSYKYLFFYTTGHGARRVFFTKDGAIPYHMVYDQFQNLFVQRYFFFDCCRSVRLDDCCIYVDKDEIPEIPGSNIKAGNKIIYATLDGETSWGPGDGVSFMTLKMCNCLKEEAYIDQMITRLKNELPKYIEVQAKNITQQPMLIDAAPDVNLVDIMNKKVKPLLCSDVLISNNHMVAEFSWTIPPPPVYFASFNIESTQIQTCMSNETWIDLNPPTIPTPNSPMRQVCSNNGSSARDTLVHSGSEASYYGTFQPTSPSIQHTVSVSQPSLFNTYTQLSTTQRVVLPVNRPQNEVKARFRLVVIYRGGMRLESNVVESNIGQTPKLTVTNACILRRIGCGYPKMKVNWQMQESLSLMIHSFSVTVSLASSDRVKVYTKAVEVGENHCSIKLPEHQTKDLYSVVVTAQLSDDVGIPSDSVSNTEECCFSCCRHLLWLSALLLFALFFASLAILIGGTTSLPKNYNNSLSALPVYNIIEIEVSPVSYAFGYPDMAQQTVSWSLNSGTNVDSNSNTEDCELNSYCVFCSEYTKLKLSNSRRSTFIDPENSRINQQNKYLNAKQSFLPLGSSVPSAEYLLPKSTFSVYICLAGLLENGTLPHMEVLLFNYDAWKNIESSKPLQSVNVVFNDSLCSNTSITVLEANFVVSGLSATSNIELKKIQAFINKIYYDNSSLNLVVPSNSIPEKKQVIIPGGSDMKLLCYVSGGHHLSIPPIDITTLIPFVWITWLFAVLISICVLSFIFLIINLCWISKRKNVW